MVFVTKSFLEYTDTLRNINADENRPNFKPVQLAVDSLSRRLIDELIVHQ